MNVKVEELSSIKKKLVIEIAEDVVSDELAKTFKEIAKTADIKGFRKGKVPRKVLEQHYGSKALYDAAGSLINNSLYKALIDEKIEAVAQPQVTEAATVEAGKPFVYEAEVEIRPVVVAKDYRGLALEKEKLVFDAETVVETQLGQMADSRVQLEVSSREVACAGDTLVIDFEGSVDGELFEGGAASDYQLELGSNSFIPGFEDQLVGMEREQKKEVQVTFPENYGAENLAGKDATFKVLVKEIKEKVRPALDDDFAKQFEVDTLDELKKRIAEDGKKQQEQRIDSQLHEAMMNKLLENNPFEVPSGMVANQLRYMKDNFAQRLQSQGMSLEMLGMNDETFNKSYYGMAEQQVKGELLLHAIAEQEEIVVEDADAEAKIKEFAEQGNTPLEQIQKYFENEQALEGLKGQIASEKTHKFLIEQATIDEVEPSVEEEPQVEAEVEEAGEVDEKES
jgi:trigger factor